MRKTGPVPESAHTLPGINRKTLSLYFFILSFLWISFSSGFVTYFLDTFKFVPAAGLFLLAWLLIIPDLKASRKEILCPVLLLGFFVSSILPSCFYSLGYNRIYLAGIKTYSFFSFLYIFWGPWGISLYRKIFWPLFTVVLGLLSVFGVLEFFGLIFLRLNWQHNTIAVFFNNPNLYSGFLLFLMPPTASLALSVRRGRLRLLILCVLVLGTVNLLMAQSRAAIAAWIFSLCITLLFILKQEPNTRIIKKGLFLSAAALTIVLAAGIFFIPGLKGKMIRSFTSPNSRVLAYRTALDIWTESPRTIFFGRGLGSFKPLFFIFKPPEYRAKPHMPEWDAVHNEYLEILVDGGITSLILYSLFLLLLFRKGIRFIIKKEKDRRDRLFLLGIAVTLAALLADGLLSTNLRVPYLEFLFYIFCGFLARGSRKGGVPEPVSHPGSNNRIIRIIILAFIPLLLAQGIPFLRRFRSEHFMVLGIKNPPGSEERAGNFSRAIETDRGNIHAQMLMAAVYLEQGRWSEGLEVYKKAEKLIPKYHNIPYGKALAFLGLGDAASAGRILEEHLKRDQYDLPAETAYLFTLLLTDNDPNKTEPVFRRILYIPFIFNTPGSETPKISIVPGGEIKYDPAENTLVFGFKALSLLAYAIMEPEGTGLEKFSFRFYCSLGFIFDELGLYIPALFWFSRAEDSAFWLDPSRAREEDILQYDKMLYRWYSLAGALLASEKTAGTRLYYESILYRITGGREEKERLAAAYRSLGMFKAAGKLELR